MNDAHNALDVNNGQQACRQYIYTMSPILVIHIAPPISSSLPPVDPLLSRCSTFPRQLVRPRIAIIFLLPRACMYFSSSFFFYFESGIRGRNRKRHGRVSNRYSVAVSHTAGRDTTVENARAVTKRTAEPRTVASRQREHVQSRECASNSLLPLSPALRRVVVQIGRASRTYARKLSSVFFATWKHVRGCAGRLRRFSRAGRTLDQAYVLPAETLFRINAASIDLKLADHARNFTRAILSLIDQRLIRFCD